MSTGKVEILVLLHWQEVNPVIHSICRMGLTFSVNNFGYLSQLREFSTYRVDIELSVTAKGRIPATICYWVIALINQFTTPAYSQADGTNKACQPSASEAKEDSSSWSRHAVAAIANVHNKIDKATEYSLKLLPRFSAYVIFAPLKYTLSSLSYPFTRSRTTHNPQQGPAQKLPLSIKKLEYKFVVDPQKIQEKLKKELRIAEIQAVTNYPKVCFNGNMSAAGHYLRTPEVALPTDNNHVFVTRPPCYLGDPGRTTIHYNLIRGTQTGVAYAQGMRLQMEDSHIASHFTVTINNTPVQIDITGIFDGHGGSGWSQYASQHIARHLEQNLEIWNPDGLNDTGIWNALKIALVDLDNDGPMIPTGQPAKPFINELKKSGTTANIALRINDDLWVINLGDSRAILIDNRGYTRQISEDAEPGNTRYKHSIEKRGGGVFKVYGISRVCGVMAVARSLGDHSLNGILSARGKVTKIPASECSKGILIQVCDGVTEVASSRDIGNTVYSQLKKGSPVHIAAAKPLAKAYQAGSGDNMTVMVTLL